MSEKLENQIEFTFMKELKNEEKQTNFEDKLFLYGVTTSLITGLVAFAICDYFNATQVYDIVQKFIGN